jgi:hypothetical protein
MGFSAEDQLALFKRLDISLDRQGKWLLSVILPSLFIAMTIMGGRLRKHRYRKSPEDQALRIYGRFLVKLGQIGMPKAPHQGPLDHARRVMEQHPPLKRDVDDIIGQYIALRYGPCGGVEALKAFRLRVRQFKPRQVTAGGSRSSL